MDLHTCCEALLNDCDLCIKPSQSVPGELEDPLKNLPRVIDSAIVVVITLFILANASFCIFLSLNVLQSTNAVATVNSVPIAATIDNDSSLIETEGPRLSAMSFLAVQIQPSSQVSCAFRVLAP